MIPGLSFGEEPGVGRVLECPISTVGKKFIAKLDPPQEGELWAFEFEWNIILVAPGAMKGEIIKTVTFQGGLIKEGTPSDLLRDWIVISEDLVGIVMTEPYDPAVPVSLRLIGKDKGRWVEKMRAGLTAKYVRKRGEEDRFTLKYDAQGKKFEVTSRDYLGKIKFSKKVDLDGTVEEIGAVEK